MTNTNFLICLYLKELLGLIGYDTQSHRENPAAASHVQYRQSERGESALQLQTRSDSVPQVISDYRLHSSCEAR